MAYTVNTLARMSGVSVRTLHYYDEIGLLSPAYQGSNGYRFYQEPQLLKLQQILFYREIGFELKQIKDILGRADFEKLAALRSHREVLEESLTRTRTLLGTIEKTINHLEGTQEMTGEEMFAGFSVASGRDRFEEQIRIGDEPVHCKVSGRDTAGAMCVFEWTGVGGGPRHLHHDQDEWLYVVEGEIDCEVGDQRRRLTAGESIFLPRKVSHVWVSVGPGRCKVINMYQPAGKIEDFFRELGRYADGPPMHEVVPFDEFCAIFVKHGIEPVGPPLVGEWDLVNGFIMPKA